MTTLFNHTIVAARDKHQSASFFTKTFDLPGGAWWGFFAMASTPGSRLPT
ncbi:MAG: hypothetical protein ACRDST_18510 [Pseudonocardiaceae bacterium]